eukprot:scaffold237_cov181-Alexandrium_tamarense.AAC.43
MSPSGGSAMAMHGLGTAADCGVGALDCVQFLHLDTNRPSYVQYWISLFPICRQPSPESFSSEGETSYLCRTRYNVAVKVNEIAINSGSEVMCL